MLSLGVIPCRSESNYCLSVVVVLMSQEVGSSGKKVDQNIRVLWKLELFHSDAISGVLLLTWLEMMVQ